MCHKFQAKLHVNLAKRSQQGFVIISAIFLLLVLAGLGAFIATISTHQHIGAALDMMGSKAYYAARSGTEWGVYRAVKATPPCDLLTNIGVIDTMTVSVTCAVIAPTTSVTEAGMGIIYSITATACNIPLGATCPGVVASPNYVERRVSVLVDTTQH